MLLIIITTKSIHRAGEGDEVGKAKQRTGQAHRKLLWEECVSTLVRKNITETRRGAKKMFWTNSIFIC